MLNIVYKCECGMAYTEGSFKKIKNKKIKKCVKCGKEFNE